MSERRCENGHHVFGMGPVCDCGEVDVRNDPPRSVCPTCGGDGEIESREPQAEARETALQRLRERIVELREGTQPREPRGRDRREVETIHKTLNVVIGEIDKLLAVPPVEKPKGAAR